MKINWNENPFRTTVELDDRDRKILLLAYQVEEFTDILCYADMTFGDENETFTDESRAKKMISNWRKIVDLDENSEQIKDLEEYLKYQHSGDCTCVPCSCPRCQVEDFLSINTIEGLEKHSAYKIQNVFERFDIEKKEFIKLVSGIDEAIEKLSEVPEYKPSDGWLEHSTVEYYNQQIPRWEREREYAVKWLKEYKKDHGF